MSHLLPDEETITSAVLITSKKGTVRANHYHKKDIHHVYIVSGKMEYSYKDQTKKTGKKRTITVRKNEVISTYPKIIHAMKFLEDTVFLALTTEPRKKRQYEDDTVRIKLI